MLLVIIRVGNCTDWKRGFGIPGLRFFVVLTEVVDFLILLQVSVERRNGDQTSEPCSSDSLYLIQGVAGIQELGIRITTVP